MHYIKLQPLVRKDGFIKKKPLQIYAIPNVREEKFSDGSSTKIGEPPFYKVTGVEDGGLVLEELVKDSDRYNKVLKYVGVVIGGQHESYSRRKEPPRTAQRRVFNHTAASCHVTEEEVIKMLSE